jgi:hypothetical protein
MERLPTERSGVFGLGEDPTPARGPGPEALILFMVWLAAITQVVIGLLRGGAFGTDRSLALVFAIACPLFARRALADRAIRLIHKARSL